MIRNSALPVLALIGLVCASLVSQACSGGSSAPPPQVVPTVGSITVMPSVASIEVGKTQQYAAVVKDTNGNILSGVTVGWSSSQQGVATIDSNGLAQGLGPGTANITASNSGITSQLVILTVTSAPVVSRASLPPWLTFCDNALCQALPQVVVAACPSATPCSPSRSTMIIPQVNGVPISGLFFTVNAAPLPTLRLVSGDGQVVANLAWAFTASSVKLQDDQDATISYYNLPPVWGGTTPVNFTTTNLTSALVDTWVYQHPSYTLDASPADVHAHEQTIIQTERDITGITTSEHVTAYFLPTELTASRGGEGNFSFGNGTITINYGNPPYIAALGGILNVMLPEVAHEYAHELFDEIKGAFLDNIRCFNEGQANAVGVTAGFIPEEKLGPAGLRGQDFRDGCLMNTEIHDVGDCYFYHVKQAGLLTRAFIFGIYHPQHTFVFDSCVMNEKTGNSLLVYFTESANGADLLPVLDAMRLPHAESYAAAKQAIGL